MGYKIKHVPDGWIVTDEYGNCIVSEIETTKEAAFVEMVRMLADENLLYVNIKPSDVSGYL